MRYEPPIFRPPSEAESLIVQATVGCSWNHCTYCAMYGEKTYRVRSLEELLAEVRHAGGELGPAVTRVFVADGDALAMELGHWEPLLVALREAFPRLRRVSAYATALNVAAKSDDELRRLRELGSRCSTSVRRRGTTSRSSGSPRGPGSPSTPRRRGGRTRPG
jgi:radical SAM superfamily enzyme YgiQ (UPF0313 family)